MTLAEQVRSLLTKRETIAAELVTIDADLAAVLEVLSVSLPRTLASVMTVPTEAAEVSIEERRRRLILALESGPMFAALIAKRPEFRGISSTAINNDLYRLKQARRVRNTAQGWTLIETNRPAASVDGTPLIRSSLPGAMGGGPACKVCECPFKDHDPTDGKCFGKNGKCVCREYRR